MLRAAYAEFLSFVEGLRSTGDGSHAGAVRTYYEQCDFQYRVLGGRSLGMHYGMWDAGARTHAEASLRTNEVMADAAAVATDEEVLDAGCGFGGSSLWLAERRRARVHGISTAAVQVRRAERLAAARGLSDRCGFSVRSYDRTGFADGSFDVCWFLESLCHSEDTGTVVAEAHRLLRPGGRIAIADGFRVRRPESALDENRLRHFLGSWVVFDLDTPGELERKIRSSGFVEFTFRDLTAAVLPDARWLYRRARRVWPVARAFDAVGLIRPAQLANLRAALLQHDIIADGLFKYGLVVARKAARERPDGTSV
jgi:SAM-dependent methyltransferase